MQTGAKRGEAGWRMLEAKRACDRLGQVSTMLESLADGSWDGSEPWASRGGSKPAHSDPTMASALSEGAARRRLEGERDRLAALVEEAGLVVAAVRAGLGDGSADALDWYFLQGLGVTWWDVAYELSMAEGRQVTATAARLRAARACAWVDEQGWERLVVRSHSA